jgi:long-chain fatty acid transport protein
MKKYALLSLALSCTLYAGGYKIPEVSTSGVALSAANVAHAHGADTAYYNPANMVFMEDSNSIEADLIYIGLDSVTYKGSVGNDPTLYNISSETEDFFIPSLNYVSPKLGERGARVGLSIVVPGGLSKRWPDSPGKDTAEEFTLEIVEVNPTVAIPVTDKLAFAFGLRAVMTSGVVKSSAAISRDMTGDTIDVGYNLALSYKPTEKLEFGATYRSKVNLTVEGNAKLYSPTGLAYDGGANVTVPLPAFATLAAAYTFDTDTTVEFVYERTMWSSYKTLDFDYVGNIGNLVPFDAPLERNWHDTDTFRVGLTQELKGMTFMAGFVIDESPVPNKTIGFELPGSDSMSFSLGGRYQLNEKIDLGLSALYSIHDARTISEADENDNGIVGEFSDGNVLIVSVGLGYKF